MNLKTYLSMAVSFLLTAVAITHVCAQKNYSFVQQENIKVAGITQDSMIYNLPVTQKQTTRTYLDGMGRVVQTIGVQASPGQNDLIQPIAYDNLGRQTIQYLPYAGQVTDTMGRYRSYALSADQAGFYNQTFQYLIATDAAPYTQQVFENSPLQRLLSAGTVGSGFQPVSGQHYKTASYRFNNSTTDGNILVWNPDGTFTSGRYYANNLLSVTDGKDEDNVETQIFKDRIGRTILKRQILSSGNLDTYYVYDMAGMLSYIVPPKAMATMAGTYSLTGAVVSKLIFHYVYDNMGRIVERTVPSKGVIYIVYDPMNRPVLMQDSNMRVSHKWNYLKYDAKGRAINQGIYTDATYTTRTTMQAYVNGLSSSYVAAWYESRSTGGTYNFYTNNVFPTSNIQPLAYVYFDDYYVNNQSSPNFNYVTQGLTGEETPTTAPVKGMPTAVSQTTVGSGVTGNEWFTKVIFYDKRGNSIQMQSSNHLYYSSFWAMTDTVTIVPDFIGVPQITKVSKRTSATVLTRVQTNLIYDHMYRIKAVDQYYNGSAIVNHIAAYTYNELGQVVKKGLGYVNPTTWLQNVDMRFNIRGQLLSINNSKLSNDGGVTNGDTNDQFGMQILYDKTDANLTTTPSYSGRISAVKWMSGNGSGGTSYERAFSYYYDQLGRDTAAIYAERTAASTSAFTVTHGWDENRITYDEGGNIKTLYRNATTQGSGSHSAIDNLTYTYSSSNPYQLASVADASGSSQGFMGGTGTYMYDGNGNLTNEPYKGLSSIAYDVLNKTDKISFSSSVNRYIDYTYDASGKLIRKRQYDNVGGVATLQNTTDYVDGFVYLTAGAGTPTLQYFPMPEGRVVNSVGTLVPTYTISDQQGNIRVEFDNTGTGGTVHLRQENSYYAYGLIMPGSVVATPTNPNKTLYNGGSEWQNDFSNLPDYYMTFNRNYDAALGRFIGVDPIAESAKSMTTYHYAGNNPIMFNDPLGNLARPPSGHANQPAIHITTHDDTGSVWDEAWSQDGGSDADNYGGGGGDGGGGSNVSGSGDDGGSSADNGSGDDPNDHVDPDNNEEDNEISRNIDSTPGESSNYLDDHGNIIFHIDDGSNAEYKLDADGKWVFFDWKQQYSANGTPAVNVEPSSTAGVLGGVTIHDNECSSCLVPGTDHRNLFNTNYTGKDNPISRDGSENYSLPPVNWSDLGSMGHDIGYEKYHAVGPNSVLTDTRTIGVDYQFIVWQLNLANPLSITSPMMTPGEKVQGLASGLYMFVATLPKTIVEGLYKAGEGLGSIKN